MESFMNELKSEILSDDFSMKNYIKNVRAIKSLSRENENYYIKLAQKGDNNAKNIVIEANLKVVVEVAKKNIHIAKLPIFDLIQEGNLGLIAAIDKFNTDLGYKFETYAVWWIKQAMFKAISEQAYCMKVPVYVQETLSKYKKIKNEIEMKFGKTATNKEVAEKMNIDENKIDSFLNANTKSFSFDMKLNDDENSMTLSEIIEDTKQNIDEIIDYQILKNAVKKALNLLKDKEKHVIIERFGLNGDEPKTLSEIGEDYGVTKECVRQIQKRALLKLTDSGNSRIDLHCYA